MKYLIGVIFFSFSLACFAGGVPCTAENTQTLAKYSIDYKLVGGVCKKTGDFFTFKKGDKILGFEESAKQIVGNPSQGVTGKATGLSYVSEEREGVFYVEMHTPKDKKNHLNSTCINCNGWNYRRMLTNIVMGWRDTKGGITGKRGDEK